MRIALVHDYLTQMGGAEKVLLTLHELFPDAPIYTSVYNPRRVDARFAATDIRTSFMQRLPLAKRHGRAYLALYPLAFEQLDLRGYDLVISDSSAFAKSVITRAEALHICYCHTPMRWAWGYEDYIEREQVGALARLALRPYITWLRGWDYATAARVDYFVANSPTVAARIAKYYRRESVVIPPPVDVARYLVTATHDEFFLVLARLVPYKRIDLAVEAFTRLKLPLWIVGEGRDEARLRRLAGDNVRFLGHQSDAVVRELLCRCRALVFPGEEDFGMAPVEAQASGRPVIAYGAGGALTSIAEGSTGIFFWEQSVEALMEAVGRLRDEAFDPWALRRHATQFDSQRFVQRFARFVETKVATHPVLARRAQAELWRRAAAVGLLAASSPASTRPILDKPTLPPAAPHRQADSVSNRPSA